MRKSLLIVAAAIGLVLAAIAGAHIFTASPQLTIAKVPEGTTARGAKTIVYGRIVSSRHSAKPIAGSACSAFGPGWIVFSAPT